MFHLYKIDTGELISSASFIADIPGGMAVKESDKVGVWNTETLDFDEITPSKRMTTLEFMELFTDLELIGILDAAKVNTTVQLFVMKMEQAEFIDLNYQPTIDGINSLSNVGLLSSERAAVILNG